MVSEATVLLSMLSNYGFISLATVLRVALP